MSTIRQQVLLLLVVLQGFYTTCNAEIVLTSSLKDEPYACIGELVSYTCTVEVGEALLWTAPPYVSTDSPIVFTAAASRGGDAESAGGICAFLTLFSPISNSTGAFTSKLDFENDDNVQSTNITCSNVTDSASIEYRLADNSEIRPPQSVDVRIDAYGTNLDEQLYLEHVTTTILWEPPEDIDSFRFAGYFVTISNSRLPEDDVMSFPVNMSTTQTRIAVLFGENIFTVQTRDACGDMSQPMNVTMDIPRGLSPVTAGLIAVGIITPILLFLLIVLIIVAVVIIYRLATNEGRIRKRKRVQDDEPLPAVAATASTELNEPPVINGANGGQDNPN